MGIIREFNKRVKEYMAGAEERNEKRLAKARTKATREKEKAKIERERLRTKREVAEARTALLKAEAKRKKAAKEVRDIGDDVFSGLRSFLAPKKARKRTTRRKMRKITTRRR